MNDNNLLQPTEATMENPPAEAVGCPPAMLQIEQPQWYVMRSAYCREMRAMELLERDGFQCYVPLREVKRERKGVIVKKKVPIVHNLVFVRSTRENLDPWKQLHENDASLRYTIDKSTRQPMTVREKAMQDFIRVTQEAEDDSLLVLDHPDVVLEKGQRVEIIAGPFKGVEGRVLRIRRDRRVVVTIDNVLAVAMASMPMSHFRVLEES